MANIKKISITGQASSANGIAQSQTPGGAGALTLNGAFVSGGIATLTPPSRVSFASTSDISNRTITVIGTDGNGNTQSEVVTGPNNSTVATSKSFATVTSEVISGSAAGAITSGTNGVSSTPWYPGDYKHGTVVLVYVELSLGAVLNYTVESTPTNLNDQSLSFVQQITQAQNATVFPSSDTNVVGASTNQQSNFINAPAGMRLTLNSWTSGTALMTIITANNNTF